MHVWILILSSDSEAALKPLISSWLTQQSETVGKP